VLAFNATAIPSAVPLRGLDRNNLMWRQAPKK